VSTLSLPLTESEAKQTNARQGSRLVISVYMKLSRNVCLNHFVIFDFGRYL